MPPHPAATHGRHADPMNLRLVIGIGLAFKLFVTAFILFCFYQLSDFADVPNPWSRHFTGVDNLTEWYTPFVNWDGQHYLHLAKWQWAQTPNSWAFFPLYPFLMFIFAHAMPAYLAGLLLNIAFTCGFCVYLCKLAQHFGAKPLPTLFILLCFPAAFFTDVVYSEAAFLFLMLGFIYHAVIAAAEGKTASWAWLYLFLLPLTRGTSVFVFGGFLLFCIQQYLAAQRPSPMDAAKQTSKQSPKRLAKRMQRKQRRHQQLYIAPAVNLRHTLGCIVAFALGVCAYLLFFHIATGDALSGVDAQLQTQFSAKNKIVNLINPTVFIGNLIEPLQGQGAFFHKYSLFDRLAIIFCMLCIGFFIAARQWALLCFYLPLVYAQAAMGEGATSYSRLVLPAIPFLAIAITRSIRQPFFVGLICIALFVVQLIMTRKFALNWWVG